MRLPVLFALLFGLLVQADGAYAADRLACIKTGCEAKGQACAAEAGAAYRSCVAAGKKTCASVPITEKIACSRKNISPCSSARTRSTNACVDAFKTCHAACGAADTRAIEILCSADVGDTVKLAFCVGAPGKSPKDQIKECANPLFGSEGGDFTCGQL